MAKRTKIVIIDDVTGGEIEDGGQTIAFSVLGVDYSIDLSPENADKFHAALEPYINAAERVGGRNNRRAASQALGGPIDTKAVRA